MPKSQPNTSARRIPTNAFLLELIRTKPDQHWKPSIEDLRKGFRGWHQRGYLPHFDAPYVTQMVTFMLKDSFPVMRRLEWEPILREADNSMKRRKLEEWLDQEHGDCWLRRHAVAEVVENVSLEANGKDFQLAAWVLTPNHVHLVVRVLDVPLTKMIGQWKGKSSRLANLSLARTGKFWQHDYFDTLIRDEAHLAKAVHYTEANPTKAAFVKETRAWRWS